MLPRNLCCIAVFIIANIAFEKLAIVTYFRENRFRFESFTARSAR